MTKTVLVPLADGFEEIEAVSIIDVLRRAGIAVTTASVSDNLTVTGAHSICVLADALISDCRDQEYDAIALPGGMPGAANLAASDDLIAVLRSQQERKAMIAAICASPAVVLHPNGFLQGQKSACYPSFQEKLDEKNRSEQRVVVGENLITGAGPGVAVEFALALVDNLAGGEKAEELRKGMLV